MWKIKNLSTQEERSFSSEEIVTIGSLEDCHFKIESHSQKNFLIQIILDVSFAFLFFENEVTTIFQETEFTLHNQSFMIQQVIEETVHSCQPTYDELSQVLQHEGLIEDLLSVQKLLTESKNIFMRTDTFSYEKIISASCKVLDKNYWKNRDVFEADHRKFYKHILWYFSARTSHYGILSLPLDDPSVTEIMVNDKNHIYLEIKGKLSLSPLKFHEDSEIFSIIERICSSVGRRIDESMPYCDARLKDGSRVHAIIPPLALNGPCLTIRKFPKKRITPNDLLQFGSISKPLLDFFEDIVSSRKNILISGGTGSGKTTLLNCLSSFIPNSERIITIEDSAELQLQQDHVVRLETRPENAEKKGAVDMRDLVKNSLRMRPDRIIMGECRGGEALDMLQAMNTGHDGSMTTVHANTPLDALRRVETLVLFAEFDLPSRAIREQVSSAIHYIIQQSRLSNGSRCVTSVHKIKGLCDKTGQFLTEEIFHYQNKVEI